MRTSPSQARATGSARRRTANAPARRISRSWHRFRASSPQTSSSRSRSRSSTPSGNRLVAMGVADLTRNAVDVLPKGELERKLELLRPLRVKLGIDPTAPDIHLGFAYVLDRLAEFQAEGHIIVLIVGDYTARIGDPSGRSDERPVLPGEVLDANAKEFADQAFRVLDRERTEVRFNGEWLGKLTYPLVVGIDGEEKMSKSRGNYIGIDEPPEEMFGKTMSIPDAALPQLWDLLVDGGAHPDDPMEWKLELARRIVER